MFFPEVGVNSEGDWATFNICPVMDFLRYFSLQKKN